MAYTCPVCLEPFAHVRIGGDVYPVRDSDGLWTIPASQTKHWVHPCGCTVTEHVAWKLIEEMKLAAAGNLLTDDDFAALLG